MDDLDFPTNEDDGRDYSPWMPPIEEFEAEQWCDQVDARLDLLAMQARQQGWEV